MKDISRVVLLGLAWLGLVSSAVMHLATFADINLGSENSLNSVMWTLCVAVLASTAMLKVRGAKLSPEYLKAQMKKVPLLGNLSSFLGVYILYVHFFGGGLVGDYVERDGQYRLQKNESVVYEVYPDQETFMAAKTMGELHDTRTGSTWWMMMYCAAIPFLLGSRDEALLHAVDASTPNGSGLGED